MDMGDDHGKNFATEWSKYQGIKGKTWKNQ